MRCPVSVFFGLLLCQVWLTTPQPLKLCFKPKLGWAGSQHSFPAGRPVGSHAFSTGLSSLHLPCCCTNFPPGVNATFWVLPWSGFLCARKWKGCFRAASPPLLPTGVPPGRQHVSPCAPVPQAHWLTIQGNQQVGRAALFRQAGTDVPKSAPVMSTPLVCCPGLPSG